MENGKNFPPDTIPRIEEEKRETGPPPEAPVPVPLTEAQRRFAAQYHALICGFLLEKKLEIREYYDIAAIGYGITLEQMKQYFIEHQHAREIGDKKMMEKIEYHLTYINFHYECGLLATGQYDKLPEVIKNW